MKYILWFIIILALWGCKNPESSPAQDLQQPDSLISRTQMIRILTDVHLTEASVAYIKNKGETPKELSGDYYNAVFSKYKISREKFKSNFDYYSRDKEKLIKMYEEVIKNLEILKKQWQPK